MKSRTILIFLSVTLVALFILSRLFPSEGVDIGDVHLHFTDLPSIVESHQDPEKKDSVTAASPMMDLKDSVLHYHRLVDSGELRFWLPEPHYFDGFWQTVEHAREQGRTVRILHYGDSQIEMDHITDRLRAYMQSNFGGGGPGMLPFQTTTPTFTVRQSNSGELVHLASFGDSLAVRSRGNYGPMMQSFRLEGGNATVTVKSSSNSHVDARAKQFSRVRLILNGHSATTVNVANLKVKNEHHESQYGKSGIKASDYAFDTCTSAFRVSVDGTADLYCLLVDDGYGVAVDNIPMRGCSGQQFTLVDEHKLSEAYGLMDVGMIIMQFGGNSVPYFKSEESISTYCRSIGKQIDHVKKCCPEARILFIGPSDMSTRRKGEVQTYPMLPQLVDSLAATAIAHGAAYWSIYHAMGGRNSMVQWSRQGLAGKDYIHFSQKGADKMGDNLAQAFDNSHVLYMLEQRLEKQKTVSVEKKTKASKGRKHGTKRKRGGRR